MNYATIRPLLPSGFATNYFHWEELDLRAGDEIARGEKLGLLAGEARWTVVAYVDEQNAHLVNVGADARLYVDGQTMKLRVHSVDQDVSRTITHPMLTTDGGGKLTVRINGTELIPERAVYRVRLEVEDAALRPGEQMWLGTVVISGGKESHLARWTRQAVSVLWRELGF